MIKDLNLPIDSIWYRKSNFYTMVVEIAKHKGDILENLASKLAKLEKNIMDNKHQNNEFGKYYKYMYAGTNNRTARVTRAEIFNKYIYEQ